MQSNDFIGDLWRLLTLADYNTRIVLFGAAILGFGAGIMGCFMMLRRRAMISDVVSHAALPGIVAAFIIMAGWPSGGKFLPLLLLGALISGLLGMGCVHVIKTYSHIKEDAALGIVLSVFFGLGVALLGIVQQMHVGSAAGLETFIYGKTASMLAADAWLMAGAAAVVVLICALFFKEFRLLCFDPEFAKSQGWPVHGLDILLTALVVLVTVIGLQAVGLILMIALLIIPPAAARFWTDRLVVMVMVSALIGAMGAVMGASVSALYPKLPAGAMIVIACSIIFAFSFMLGPRRGLIHGMVSQAALSNRIARQHLMRAIYECMEASSPERLEPYGKPALVSLHQLTASRGWSDRKVKELLHAAARDGEVEIEGWPMLRFTPEGLKHARTIVRNHRLWEWYMITHADVAPSHVDRNADEIEHVLGAAMVAELENSYAISSQSGGFPDSPHRLDIPMAETTTDKS
ncbi:MAG TPA: iron chelate uptake ABC transporter family permease subunit [Kiritimatiellia bacterium]|nr:iron chelate uptake ABC transporter family permease subunit [Kiritimatiellia bacterium]